jgi:hypothetical protein
MSLKLSPIALRWPHQARAAGNRDQPPVLLKNEIKPLTMESDDDGDIDMKLEMEIVASITTPIYAQQMLQQGHGEQSQTDLRPSQMGFRDDALSEAAGEPLSPHIGRMGRYQDEMSNREAPGVADGNPSVEHHHKVIEWIDSFDKIKEVTKSEISDTSTIDENWRLETPVTQAAPFTRKIREAVAASAVPIVPSPAPEVMNGARDNYVEAFTQTTPPPEDTAMSGYLATNVPTSKSILHVTTLLPKPSKASEHQASLLNDEVIIDLTGSEAPQGPEKNAKKDVPTTKSKTSAFTGTIKKGIEEPCAKKSKPTRSSPRKTQAVKGNDEPVVIASARVRRPRMRQVTRTVTRTETRRTVLTIRSRSVSTSMGCH